MLKENNPLLSDEFLNEVAREINQLYSGPGKEKNEEPENNEVAMVQEEE
jgi:hypothetical protein